MVSLTSGQRQQAERLLARLDRDGLLELRGLIDVLLEELEEEPEIAEPDTGDEKPAKASRGWVELKMIRGYGPYAYRRWREAGRLRSEYIGKVEDKYREDGHE